MRMVTDEGQRLINREYICGCGCGNIDRDPFAEFQIRREGTEGTRPDGGWSVSGFVTSPPASALRLSSFEKHFRHQLRSFQMVVVDIDVFINCRSHRDVCFGTYHYQPPITN